MAAPQSGAGGGAPKNPRAAPIDGYARAWGERWLTADSKVMTAPLPEGFDGHFGPQLRRFVLAQYHQGQTTVPRLLALLRGFGIDISKRELVRLLTTGHDSFHEEAREVLRAGTQPP